MHKFIQINFRGISSLYLKHIHTQASKGVPFQQPVNDQTSQPIYYQYCLDVRAEGVQNTQQLFSEHISLAASFLSHFIWAASFSQPALLWASRALRCFCRLLFSWPSRSYMFTELSALDHTFSDPSLLSATSVSHVFSELHPGIHNSEVSRLNFLYEFFQKSVHNICWRRLNATTLGPYSPRPK